MTKEHPFFVYGKGWVAADDLEIGDICRNAAGNEIILTGKEFDANPVPVYNFEVEGGHTYFVGETKDESVLVHNDCVPEHECSDMFCTVCIYGSPGDWDMNKLWQWTGTSSNLGFSPSANAYIVDESKFSSMEKLKMLASQSPYAPNNAPRQNIEDLIAFIEMQSPDVSKYLAEAVLTLFQYNIPGINNGNCHDWANGAMAELEKKGLAGIGAKSVPFRVTEKTPDVFWTLDRLRYPESWRWKDHSYLRIKMNDSGVSFYFDNGGIGERLMTKAFLATVEFFG